MSIKGNGVRDYSIDNIRFILIFLVVFAHLLEVFRAFDGSGYIYQFIYTFHMPAFIFLFGYNVKFSPKKIIFFWCIPYVVFQSLYILFANFILKTKTAFTFTTPYWLLWYMVACIFYQLILPLFDTNNKVKQIIVLILLFAVSLVIGFDNTVGYYMSLSRFFVFLPWFVLGFYFKKNVMLEKITAYKGIRITLSVVLPLIIGAYLMFLRFLKFPNGLLYGALPYEKCGGTVGMRTLILFMALCFVLFLFIVIKPILNKKIFLITKIGQNTLPVFLLHGFVVKALPVYFPQILQYPIITVALTCLLLLIFGNKLLNKAVYYIGFSWLKKE